MADTVRNRPFPQETPHEEASNAPNPSEVSRYFKFSFGKFAIAVLIALFVLGVVVLAAKYKNKSKLSTSSGQEQNAAPSPAVVLSEYSNSQYGFGFKYNEVWEVVEFSSEPVSGAKAAVAFTFKNKLEEKAANAGPNLPKLIVYVFEKNPSLDNFVSDISEGKNPEISDCAGEIKQCKMLKATDGGVIPIQVVMQGANYTYGLALFDENAALVNLNNITQPLGAVVRNFTSR